MEGLSIFLWVFGLLFFRLWKKIRPSSFTSHDAEMGMGHSLRSLLENGQPPKIPL